MILDFSRLASATRLNALLSQAGIESLDVLLDLPLATACQTIGAHSFQTRDWDLVIQTMEQSGLVNRLPFGRFDKEPDVSLKAIAPSKRTLYCLAGHGVTTLEQLQQLRLGTLLSMHHYFPGDDIHNLVGRLKEYQSSGHPSGLSNNSDWQSIPQFDLDDSTAQLPIDVLDLSSRTRQYLFDYGVQTLGELIGRIPGEASDFRSQGLRQLWKEVGDSLQSYLSVKAHHPPPTKNLPLQTVTEQGVTQQWTTSRLIEQQERPQTAPSQAHANYQAVIKGACELADLPGDFESLTSATLIPMQTGNVDGVDALPKAIGNQSITELSFPAYSFYIYNLIFAQIDAISIF